MVVLTTKQKYLIGLIENKRVLHLGATGRLNRPMPECNNSLHEILYHQFNYKELVGLDINPVGFYNIRYGDAQSFNIKKKFDLILAPDIIEHLPNLEGFLKSCKRHMAKNAKLVITTPNPFKIGNIARILFKGYTINDPNHIAYFDEHTLSNLLGNFGFRVTKIRYFSNKDGFPFRYFVQMIIGLVLERTHSTLYIEAVR